MILTDIREALAKVDQRVYYGTAAAHPKDARWDYTVYSRATYKPSPDLTSGADAYEVAVVREGFIPEGMLQDVVAAMESIPGMHLRTGAEVTFSYDLRPNTTATVEMMVVPFARAKKRAAR